MSLCIVMPAYNEEACIEPVVKAWLTVFDQVPGKLIVVNDGSRDRTGQILDQLAGQFPKLRVVHQTNAGHGAAVLNAYRQAVATDAEWVFQTDSDDQFRVEDFWKLWARREESPFIMGYRKKREDAFHRKIITKVMAGLVFLLFGETFVDANIPFRLMRTTFLAELLKLLPEQLLTPNIFLAVLAQKAGAKFLNIPIHHQERKTGKVSILRWRLVKFCLQATQELVEFRFSLIQNRAQLRALRSDG